MDMQGVAVIPGALIWLKTLNGVLRFEGLGAGFEV